MNTSTFCSAISVCTQTQYGYNHCYYSKDNAADSAWGVLVFLLEVSLGGWALVKDSHDKRLLTEQLTLLPLHLHGRREWEVLWLWLL